MDQNILFFSFPSVYFDSKNTLYSLQFGALASHFMHEVNPCTFKFALLSGKLDGNFNTMDQQYFLPKPVIDL